MALFRSFLWLSNFPLYICTTSSLSMQSRNRDTDVENKLMNTKGGRGGWDEMGDWD